MIKIIDLIITWLITVVLSIIFAPLIVIALLSALISNIPKMENTFVFDIVMWIDRLIKGFKPPWTSKKRLYFVLTYLTSVALWLVILCVIF